MPTPSDLALCRSGLYQALALGLGPPEAATLGRLALPEQATALADLARVLDEAWGSALADLVRGLAGAEPPETLARRYDQLFGHTARGAVPPYETEYGPDSLFQPMHEMSDLVAFYRAFGLRVRPDAHERPDHVSCECEFLAFLDRKEAYARDGADPAMLAATQHARRRFLRDHLGRWGPAFGRRLAAEDRGGFFGTLGALCAELVTRDCARVGVPAGPELLRLRAATVDSAPAPCQAPESVA
jgi:DMSO reductase family type II enzyme chaperone